MLDHATALRTLQVNFPRLVDYKFLLQRTYRNTLRRPFEADFRAIALLPKSDRDVYVDVGANRGQSIDAIRMQHPGCVVRSFEPNAELFVRLQWMYRDDPRVHPENVALGREPGTATLYVPFYKGYMFDGLASISEEHALGWLNAERIIGFDERHLTCRKMECAIRTLDSYEMAPSFLKLDTQGSELDVLIGGARTLRQHQPVIMCEAASEDREAAYLAPFGYRLYGFHGGRFVEGRPGDLNSFFLTDGHVERLGPQAVA